MTCDIANIIENVSKQPMGVNGASVIPLKIEGRWCNTAIAYYTLCRFVSC